MNFAHIKIIFEVDSTIHDVNFVILAPASCIARLHCHVAIAVDIVTTLKAICFAVLNIISAVFFVRAQIFAPIATTSVVPNAYAFASTA